MRQLVYTMFISHNDASFHLWRKENLVNIEKSQNIMTKIVGKISPDELSWTVVLNSFARQIFA